MIIEGNLECVRLWLDSPDIDVNDEVTENKETPLFVACEHGRIEIVRILLEKEGIDVNLGSKRVRISPLWVACSRGHIEIVMEGFWRASGGLLARGMGRVAPSKAWAARQRSPARCERRC